MESALETFLMMPSVWVGYSVLASVWYVLFLMDESLTMYF